MDFFGQVREGIAKAVHMASDSHVFHEFPECSILASTDKLSIKLKNADLHQHLKHMSPDSGFQTIEMLVRNESNKKQTLLTADVISGQGLTLKNGSNKPVMLVRLPNNDPSSLGKLMHPSAATLFKVMRHLTPVGENFLVVKTPSKEPVIKIEKVVASLYPIGKAIGVLGADCVYWFKRMDGTVLGYVRPKLVMNSNTLIVKFTSTNTDMQARAIILGVSLLLMISQMYPQLRAMLDESVRKAHVQKA